MGRSPIENPSAEAQSALAMGDVEELLRIHKANFGGFRMMAEDAAADADAGGDEDGEDSDDADEEEDEDEKDDDGRAKSTKRSVSAQKAKELHDENSRRRNENKQLREQNEKQAKRLKEIEDKDKSEFDKTAEERDSLKTTNEKLAETNRQLALQVAFLEDGTQNWHNPKAALKLLDLDGVEIGDDGVTGLDKAIKKLAEENPFLLKGAKEEDDDDSASGAPKSSGQPLSKTVQKQRSALEKKYRLGV